jgi:hypothetical protein
MEKERVKQIIKEELTKTEVNDLIKQGNEKLLKSPAFEKMVRKVSAKVTEDLYRIFWQRKSFWSDEISGGR